ncbi:MAG: class I SAM-dependent methyltransferase [Anaerolineales bacterium]
MNGLIPTGKLLLDAGSGPVQYEEYKVYSQGYEKRVCLDISIQALREARTRIGDHGLFVVGDLANLPFKADAFDGAVSMHAIHHLALTEHPRAYAEIHRVLASGRRAAIVNGWHDPFLSRMAEPLIALMRKLSGRSEKKKKEWLSEEAPAGTFVQKMTPAWLKREIGSKMTIEIKPWRSISTRILRWFVRPFGEARRSLRFRHSPARRRVSKIFRRERAVSVDRDQEKRLETRDCVQVHRSAISQDRSIQGFIQPRRARGDPSRLQHNHTAG